MNKKAKKGNGWVILIIVIVLGFIIYKYNPGLFSVESPSVSSNLISLTESKSCSSVLSQIHDSGWSYSCTSDCNVDFTEANLPWKYSENSWRCIDSMIDNNGKCEIKYSEGKC